MMNKKWIALALAGVMSLSMLTACTSTPSDGEDPQTTPPATEEPSQQPSDTETPTEEPTEEPSEQPSEEPDTEATPAPTPDSTPSPTPKPTEKPSEKPQPTEEPSEAPSGDVSVSDIWAAIEDAGEQPDLMDMDSLLLPTEEPSEQPSEEPDTEATPAPTPDSTPSPTPKPTEKPSEKPQPTEEPSEAPSGDVSVSDIWAAIEDAGEQPDLMDMDSLLLTDLYGMDAEADLVEFVAKMPLMSANVTEFLIAKVTPGRADAVKAACESRVEALKGGGLYPSTVELVENYKIVINGDYLLFCIAENADEVVEIFNSYTK